MRYVISVLFIVWSFLSVKELIKNYRLHCEGVDEQISISASAWLLVATISVGFGIIFFTVKYW